MVVVLKYLYLHESSFNKQMIHTTAPPDLSPKRKKDIQLKKIKKISTADQKMKYKIPKTNRKTEDQRKYIKFRAKLPLTFDAKNAAMYTTTAGGRASPPTPPPAPPPSDVSSGADEPPTAARIDRPTDRPTDFGLPP